MQTAPITQPDHKSICSFIKHNVVEDQINYPRDCKNFIKLWNDYPDWSFWSEHFKPYQGKYALHAYLGSKGTEYLKKQWNLFLLEKIEKNKQIEYNLNKQSLEKIIIQKGKPRTIREFLKYNYEQDQK